MADFYDSDYQDPAPALVGVLRGLPLGGHVTLSNGRTVKSVTMNNGPSKVRRFAVMNKGERPPRMMTAATTHGTAEDAAKAALQKERKK